MPFMIRAALPLCDTLILFIGREFGNRFPQLWQIDEGIVAKTTLGHGGFS